MIAIFHEDAAALGCLPPTFEPRATDHIAPMIAIMEKLIANGHAYAADGHVLFDVPSMPDYGRLANKGLDEQIAGARIEVAPYKRSATDFVLWKPSAPAEPGWDSPWGRGRPGWHLECSAMSWQLLGETFDIHGGGIDLVFPHHENEIAQSRCAFGHDLMARVWMHNGHLQVEGEKMSKSLGNFVTIRDLWASLAFGGRVWSGDALRLAMLRTHYRQPIDFTVKGLEEANATLNRWANAIRGTEIDDSAEPQPDFVAALSDDLNTPRALAILHTLFSSSQVDEFEVGEGSELGWDVYDPADASVAVRSAALLGINVRRDVNVDVSGNEISASGTTVEVLVELRKAARASKDWKESDRLRDELLAMGIIVKDKKDGTTTLERQP